MVTNITKITIVFSKNRVQEYTSWAEFLRTNFEISDHTESVILNWEMNFKLPAHQLPQPHIMKLKIGSALNPSEMFHLIMSKDEHEIHSDMAHTVCSINFINSVICNELFTIVFDWHEALPSLAKQKKALVFLRDHPGRFTELIKIMFVLSGIYALVAVTHLLLNASSS
jgi:hypothetical protein